MLIDLTHPLNEVTPVYPGDPTLTIQTSANFETEKYLGHSLSMGTHAGTHIDAPAHMIDGAKTLDQFDVDAFVGPVIVITLKDYTYDLANVQNAGIKPGDMVLFDTGMGQTFHTPEYFTDYPVMSQEIAEYLVSCGIKMVGVDTCSADNTPDFPIHKILLGHDILIAENLANLSALPATGAKLYALPLRLDLDGAPARVVAEVQV